MDTVVPRDSSFLGKMPGREGTISYAISETICQFDASSWMLAFVFAACMLANLLAQLSRSNVPSPFSFHLSSTPSQPPWYHRRCYCCRCWPVWFLAFKIYLLYKWNPRSRSPATAPGDSWRIASSGRTLSWYTVFEAADNSRSDTTTLCSELVENRSWTETRRNGGTIGEHVGTSPNE